MARIFLCHASDDKPQVRDVYYRLEAEGFDPWLDAEDLLPGQEWDHEIEVALEQSDFVMVFLSKRSVGKRGYVQREFRRAMSHSEDMPEGYIHTIPVKLDDCEVPRRFSRHQWVNLNDEGAFDRIVRALHHGLQQRGEHIPSPLETPHKSLIPIVTYSPAHGPKRELLRDSFVFLGSSEFIEGIYVPWGLSRVEIVLTSPHGDQDDLYSYFFQKYDTQALNIDPRILICELDGLDTAKWKVTIQDVDDIALTETRQLITKLIEIHNQQVAKVISLFNMLASFVDQSPLAKTITTPEFDGRAFIELIKHDEEIPQFMNDDQINAFVDEMEAAMARAEGVEVEVDEFFGSAFPFIILATYLKAKYPDNYMAHARFFAGLEDGEDPLFSESEKQMLLMIEFWAILSQDTLRQLWAEFKIEHLSPDEADTLERFFVDQGMAGAVHQYGGVLELFRLASKDSFDAYFMLLSALHGLRRPDDSEA